jgi:hypothetical protein
LPSKRQLVQKAVSWLVVALGALPGLYGLVMLSRDWVPEDHVRPDWLTLWLQAVGLAILGLVFLIASSAALRHRRLAGLSFLISAPVAAFCLAFEDAYLRPPFRGYDWRSPSLVTAILFVCVLFIPFYAPLATTRDRKRAVPLFLILALLSGLVFRLSPWSAVLLPRLVPLSALFLVFGAFWLATDKLGWPRLVAARSKSLPGRLATVLIGCILVAILVLAGTFALSARESDPWGPDCGERQLFARPLGSGHAVFTARAVRVGHTTRILGKWAGGWAIGLVQKRFWGLPWWSPRLVLLTNYPFWEGQTYFIDGRRDPRLLNRFLPIVEAGHCTSTRPVADATIQLHLLQDAPSPNGARIVGQVWDHRRPEVLSAAQTLPVVSLEGLSDAAIEAVQEQRRYEFLSRPLRQTPLAGARIRVTGSSRCMIVTADRDGFYGVAGLPPDDYTLELLDVPDTQRAVNGSVKKKELLEKKLIRADLYIFGNRAIEGRARDSSTPDQ